MTGNGITWSGLLINGLIYFDPLGSDLIRPGLFNLQACE